jgi:hypothetical protein
MKNRQFLVILEILLAVAISHLQLATSNNGEEGVMTKQEINKVNVETNQVQCNKIEMKLSTLQYRKLKF